MCTSCLHSCILGRLYMYFVRVLLLLCIDLVRTTAASCPALITHRFGARYRCVMYVFCIYVVRILYALCVPYVWKMWGWCAYSECTRYVFIMPIYHVYYDRLYDVYIILCNQWSQHATCFILLCVLIVCTVLPVSRDAGLYDNTFCSPEALEQWISGNISSHLKDVSHSYQLSCVRAQFARHLHIMSIQLHFI